MRVFSYYKRFVWLVDIIHGLYSHSMGSHFYMFRNRGSCFSNGEIWPKIKVEEKEVLFWQGSNSGDDPFADDGEMEAPNSRDFVGLRGGKRMCGNKISTKESLMVNECEIGMELLGFNV